MKQVAERRPDTRVNREYRKIYDQLDSKEITAFEKIKLRKKRKRQMRRRMQMAAFFAVCIFVIYLFTPFSKVQSINVYGNKIVNSSSIIEMSKIEATKSIRLLNWRMFVTGRIEENPFIAKAEMTMAGGGQMNITVTERRVIFKTMKNDNWYAYFEDGTNTPIPKDYIVEATTLLPVEQIETFPYEELAQNLATVPPEIIQEISEIKHTPSELDAKRFTLYMKDRNRVVILMHRIQGQLKWYFKLVELSDGRRFEYVMEYAGDVFGRAIE